MTFSRRLLAAAGAAAFFLALAIWPMLRVAAAAASLIPGAAAGDNVTALWNTWWFAYALDHARPVYWTPMLFAPVGTQLSLHTHATTHSVLAWPFAATGAVVGGHNLAMLIGLTLNGFAAWLLALRLTGDRAASLVAGTIFSLSAFIQVHALGHVNLLHAWVLPFFALAVVRFAARARPLDAMALGGAAALVAYTDYYFAVYAGVFAVAWLVPRSFSFDVRLRPPHAPRWRTVVLGLLALDLAVIAIIAVTGGTVLDTGFARISIRGMRNPLTVAWLLLGAWAVARYPLRISVSRRSSPAALPASGVAMALLTAALLTAPLWLALLAVVNSGDYSTQQVLWRSSPAGTDLATMLLGHPRHLVWGGPMNVAYGALGIDVIEQSLWLGLIPLALIAARRRTWGGEADARFWLAVGLLFFVLSLGPFLRVAGAETGLPLPHALLRYLPGFSNARIPGRAVVMVQLAVAVLSAFALAGVSKRRWIAAALVMVVLESVPSRLPAYLVPQPDAVDAELFRAGGAGSVAELPVGLRDGFGEVGQLDHRALAHQLWHRQPLVGGFVARLSHRARRAQLESPPIAAFLDLSSPLSRCRVRRTQRWRRPQASPFWSSTATRSSASGSAGSCSNPPVTG
jgi:hypothetical protein